MKNKMNTSMGSGFSGIRSVSIEANADDGVTVNIKLWNQTDRLRIVRIISKLVERIIKARR